MIRGPERRTSVLFIRNLDKDIKDRFKAWCSLRGLSMTSTIQNMMLEKITNRKKQSKKSEIKIAS